MPDQSPEYIAYYQSEIGWLEIVGTATAIKTVSFVDNVAPAGELNAASLPPPVAACLVQLDEYFKGERCEFDLPLAPDGTEFQQAVWQQLARIPYGQTTSYGEVARAIGNTRAVRAVGAANGQNKVVIIVPCHRVIGSDGRLTGYGGGLWRKEWLLNHEQAGSPRQLSLF